jgi:hypothetical protein
MSFQAVKDYIWLKGTKEEVSNHDILLWLSDLNSILSQPLCTSQGSVNGDWHTLTALRHPTDPLNSEMDVCEACY